MEGAKKFLVMALTVSAGVALYDLVFKPIINKAKTSLPSTTTTTGA